MTETPGPGAKVVLYACTTSGGDVEAILAELRQHANAHRWAVVEEFWDRTGAAPEEGRPNFQAAKVALADGLAEGLVTRYPAMAAYLPDEREAFADFLDGIGAFAHYTWAPPNRQAARQGGDGDAREAS